VFLLGSDSCQPPWHAFFPPASYRTKLDEPNEQRSKLFKSNP
jgi:hypothetical protein